MYKRPSYYVLRTAGKDLVKELNREAKYGWKLKQAFLINRKPKLMGEYMLVLEQMVGTKNFRIASK